MLGGARRRLERWSRAPDGKPRPDAPFGRGPIAARVLGRVIDGAAWAGSRLPARLAHGLAIVGGNVEWALRPRLRGVLRTNLAHALGQPRDAAAVGQAVRREVVHEARRSADLLWAIGRPLELLDTIEVIGIEHPKAVLADGRGVVLAGIHLGGWEVAVAAPAAVIPAPTSVIAADNWLAWAIQHRRAAAGLHVIYRQHAALGAVHLLRRGEALLVLGEDATGAAGHRHLVRFCDATAHLPSGVATLARLSNAAIVPFVVVPRGRRRWQIVIEPVIEPPSTVEDEPAVLQEVADRWTAIIQAYPDHWAARFPIAWEPVR